MATAFQSPTTRMAWLAAAALDQYDAVEVVNGKLAKATGAGQFVGIVEYGAEAADRMATAVKGIFPGVAAEAIVTGDKLTVGTGENAGKFIKAVAATTEPVAPASVVYGVALNDAGIGELVSVLMADVIAPVVTA